MSPTTTETDKIAKEIYDRQQNLLNRTDNKGNILLTVLTIAAAIVGFLMPIALGEIQGASFFFAIFVVPVFLFFIAAFLVLLDLLEVLGPHTIPPSEQPGMQEPKEAEILKVLFRNFWTRGKRKQQSEAESSPSQETFSYYTSIRNESEAEYSKQIREKTQGNMIDENISQAHVLAVILYYKMFFLEKAEVRLRYMFILLGVIVIIIFVAHWLL